MRLTPFHGSAAMLALAAGLAQAAPPPPPLQTPTVRPV
jgi:hypothetical protein